MKKQLLNLSVAFAATMLFAGSALAQDAPWAPKTVTIKHVAVPPTIDGLNREWVDVPAQELDVPYKVEEVSFTAPATFKAVWADSTVYVLVTVPDDDFYPAADAGEPTATWSYDKPEIYFDNNATILEVGEANCGAQHTNSGHHQFAPSFNFTDNTNYQWAYDADIAVDDATTEYFVEYALGVSVLVNRELDTLEKFVAGTVMGFDATVIDLDEATATDGIQRINWSNNTVDTREGGIANEGWASLDASGEMTLSADEIVLPTSIQNVTLNANAISPNVTSTTFAVTIDATNVAIINSIGQVVKEVNSNFGEINVAELPAGLYIVKINNNTTSKLLKR